MFVYLIRCTKDSPLLIAVIFTSAVRMEGLVSLSGAVKSHITTLTDAATVALDFNDANMFLVTLGGNRTLAAPSNATAGQVGSWYISYIS